MALTAQLTDTLQPDVFTAVFMTDENLAATQAVLPAGIRTLAAADSDKEFKYHYNDGTREFHLAGLGKAADLKPEALRKALHAAVGKANDLKKNALQVVFQGSAGLADPEYFAIALGEMPVLSNYQFKKYTQDAKPRSLQAVKVLTNLADARRLLEYGQVTAEETCRARDLVNEPPNVIYPETLAQAAQAAAQQHGFRAEVWNKARIEQEGFGGLLAVNLGSLLPPTFTILEYKPNNPANSQPIVLVGKGITFDTGGLSLKPSESMVGMKGDMAGAAAVIGAVTAAARNKLGVHVVGLIPSTDNRPGYNAYTPNDVVKMHNGLHVEVLNTDAEGRMILADALSYAKTFNPALVIDLATLTGAAVIGVGEIATAFYSTAEDVVSSRIVEAGDRTHERLVRLPLWDEYAEQIKSDIADLKNVGGRPAGSITAAKFLQRFAEGYPWMHLDIAGPAYLDSANSYRPKGGTGCGVRLLTEFLRRYAA
jgi:leucyl aminopeptidase